MKTWTNEQLAKRYGYVILTTEVFNPEGKMFKGEIISVKKSESTKGEFEIYENAVRAELYGHSRNTVRRHLQKGLFALMNKTGLN